MNYFKKLFPLAIASLGILGNTAAASAVNFNFSYAPGTTMEQKVGFEMAGQIWSNYLTDDFTVNIYVETTDLLADNVIGGALPGIEAKEGYKEFRKELEKDITSIADAEAVSNLVNIKKKHDKFYAMVNGSEIEDIDDLVMTRANAKSVGFLSKKKDKKKKDLDGYILMSNLENTSVSWDYNFVRQDEDDSDDSPNFPDLTLDMLVGNNSNDIVIGGNSNPVDNDGSENNKLDYLSVALHEVGHVMGFISGVDNPGWLNVVTESVIEGKEIKKDDVEFFNPLDLYRYSGESTAAGIIDLSIGGNPYFSIDKGNTALANFATGQDSALGGDGYQASHWQRQDIDVLGIMDPVLNIGQTREVTDLDLQAFDVIGYDINSSAILDWTTMSQNAVESASNASEEDRTEDVEKMIDKSEIYEWGGGWKQSTDSLWQQAYFSHFAWQTIDLPADSQSVPESNLTIGLLGLGLFGFGQLLKRKK